jgi:hypothetical protein
MSTIVTRAGKGSPLTHAEVDANFTNLDTDKVEKTAAAITGGTINGTTIGATTPSTVNATTITGQTARLNGTGQNLFTFSQNFTNAIWLQAGASATGTTTDPLGGSTANTITASAGSATHDVSQSYTATQNFARTVSVFAKSGTNNFLQICFLGEAPFFANFDLNAGTLGTSAGVTATITPSNNGFYRCSVTYTSISATSVIFEIVQSASAARRTAWTAAGTETIILWGAQVEFGSTANTYIPTTTTAVYGTPTLSFSGVSEIGLLSNGSLYLQPAGTGALQAQATTSTTAGGNARGANAVDWQTLRGSAAQVASGFGSTTSGGASNTATATYSAAVGGNQNVASGTYAFLGGGLLNTASGYSSVTVGGVSNTAAGYFNFIGGGFTNSGTALAAVTTQATTAVTSGSTAVTLSATNASIRVGQYITGTGIASDTYVSAISTTSLTLSKNATATGTPTLSFFTPHGVVVGGGNNQATGSYSFIGGGGDAGTAANRNVASGDWSIVGGGVKNTASGGASFVGGGGWNGAGVFSGNTASATSSVVVGGNGNQAQSSYAFVAAGFQNVASGRSAAVLSGEYGTTRNIIGNTVFAASQTPVSATLGVQQAALLVLGAQTTDATATALTSSAAAAGTTNQVILPNNSAYLFKATVISNVTGGGNTSAWKLEGAIKRGANAASTTIVGLVTTTLLAQDAGAATWAIAATADTTNGGLRITFTGQASTTIRTVCKVETTEVTF